MRLIDSHCHLNYEGLADRQLEILARARAKGVAGFLNISTRQTEWRDVLATAQREPDVWASVGIHPHYAHEHPDVTAETLTLAAGDERVIGLGETGLDYHYGRVNAPTQQAMFRAHIEAARRTGLPVIIHTRDAEADTIAILREELGQGAFPALIHCFTGSAKFASQCLELGLFISFSGIVTFSNATELQTVAKDLAVDRILMETDSPFLSPVPHRGKPCEPAFISDTAAFLADLRGESLASFAQQTCANFGRLFARAGP